MIKYKHNYYNIDYSNSSCEALIFFSTDNITYIKTFKELVLESVFDSNNFMIFNEIGQNQDMEEYAELFYKSDTEFPNHFTSLKSPGLLSKLFRTSCYNKYITLRNDYMLKRQFSIMYDCNFDPSIEIYSKVHSFNEMNRLISNTANHLKIELDYIENIDDMEEIN